MPDVKEAFQIGAKDFQVCYMHCLTVYCGILSKPAKNLPVILSVTHYLIFRYWKNEYGIGTAVYLLQR
jgi:hypothetical protein